MVHTHSCRMAVRGEGTSGSGDPANAPACRLAHELGVTGFGKGFRGIFWDVAGVCGGKGKADGRGCTGLRAGLGQVLGVSKNEMVQTFKALEISMGVKCPIDERPAGFTSLSLLLSPTACV